MSAGGLRAEGLGPLCGPVLATGTAVFRDPHHSAEHTSQMQRFHWDPESYSASDQEQTTKSDYDLFLVQVWLWEVFWNFFSIQPLSWSSPAVV